MKQYLELADRVMRTGTDKSDRTGVGTRSVFGAQLRFDLQEGFPLLTTKKMFTKGIIHELLWMLSGSRNIHYLVENGVSIWTDWPLQKYNAAMTNVRNGQLSRAEFEKRIVEDPLFGNIWGDVGPGYGHNWRHFGQTDTFPGVDQIAQALALLRTDPDSRRNFVTAWDPVTVDLTVLPPCHHSFQLTVTEGRVNLDFNMRSTDVFLGLPFNLAFYGLLCHMFAQQADLQVGELLFSGVDVHLYKNHFEQIEQQLSRAPMTLPTLTLRKAPSMFEYQYSDIGFTGYSHWPALKGEVAV